MGNKLSCSCAPLIRKAYRYEDSPWQATRRRDGHLLRLWAEVFHVSAQGNVKWQQVSEDLVPVNITCIQDTPECVFHITAYNSQVDKILDVRLVQPGTRLGQASECFVYWKDPATGDTWGLNFTSPIDAKQFRECCSPSFKFSRKASSSYSLKLEPPKKVKSKRKPLSTPSSPSRLREPQCTCMTRENLHNLQRMRAEARGRITGAATLPRAQSRGPDDVLPSVPHDRITTAPSSSSVYDNVAGLSSIRRGMLMHPHQHQSASSNGVLLGGGVKQTKSEGSLKTCPDDNDMADGGAASDQQQQQQQASSGAQRDRIPIGGVQVMSDLRELRSRALLRREAAKSIDYSEMESIRETAPPRGSVSMASLPGAGGSQRRGKSKSSDDVFEQAAAAERARGRAGHLADRSVDRSGTGNDISTLSLDSNTLKRMLQPMASADDADDDDDDSPERYSHGHGRYPYHRSSSHPRRSSSRPSMLLPSSRSSSHDYDRHSAYAHSDSFRSSITDRSLYLELAGDQSPPSDHVLFDHQCYATTPSSSNGDNDNVPGGGGVHGNSPTSRLLMEYEMHLRNTLARGLDAESYSLHTFEALLTQSMENLESIVSEMHVETHGGRSRDDPVSYRSRPGGTRNKIDIVNEINRIHKKLRPLSTGSPPMGRSSTLPLSHSKSGMHFSSASLAAARDAADYHRHHHHHHDHIVQQASLESADSRLCYLTSSEISDDERMSLTTAISDEDDVESAHNSPYKSRISVVASSTFNCTGAVRKAGFLSVKKWLLRKKHQVELARKRGWKGYWVCLKGTTLLFYPCDNREGRSIDNTPKHLIIVDGAIMQPIPEHPKREYIFCLSTAFGDAYLFQAPCQVELENWVNSIHSACAAAFARHRGKTGTLHLLQEEIYRLDKEIESDGKMRHMADLQLTVVSDVDSRQTLLNQINQWEENLERLHCELFRIRCYMASLQNTELPNPKNLLAHVSRGTKNTLNRLGVFTVSSFHAYVSARSPSLLNNLLAGRGATKRRQSAILSRSNSGSSRRSLNLSTGGGTQDLPGLSEKPQKVTLPDSKSATIYVPEGMTVEEFLSISCSKRQLIPSDHFLRFFRSKDPDEFFVPHRNDLIESLSYVAVEVCAKILYQVELSRSTLDQMWGFSVEAELVENAERQDELCVMVSRVEDRSLAMQQGIMKVDEIMVINGAIVSDLDMMYIESVLQEELSLCMMMRSCRTEPPEFTTGLLMKSTDDYIDQLVCPPPPSDPALSEEMITGLIVPPAPAWNQARLLDRKMRSMSSKQSSAEVVEPPDASSEQIETLLKTAEEVTSEYCRSPMPDQMKASPPPSSTPPAVPFVPGRQLTDAEKLRKVINELIETEHTYVKHLNNLLEHYLEPLKKATFLSNAEINALFGNIQEIVAFQRVFLQSLEDAVDAEPEFHKFDQVSQFKHVLFSLGGSFLYYANHFKLYSSFCASHSKAQKVLHPNEGNQSLQEFLQSRNPKQQHSSTLESYLIKPIQRILKYPLLLQQLKNLTSATSDEHQHLAEALKGMEKVAEHINEMQRIHEEYGAIFDHLFRQHMRVSKQHVDLSPGELLYYGGVEWLNIAEFLGKIKKGLELHAMCFVFKTAVVFLCKERIRQKKKLMGGSSKANHSEVEIIRYQVLIPVTEVQVRASSMRDVDSHFMWELIHLKSHVHRRSEKTYHLSNSTSEFRNAFLKTIRQIIRESVRNMSIPANKPASRGERGSSAAPSISSRSSRPGEAGGGSSAASMARTLSNKKKSGKGPQRHSAGNIANDASLETYDNVDQNFRTRSRTVGDAIDEGGTGGPGGGGSMKDLLGGGINATTNNHHNHHGNHNGNQHHHHHGPSRDYRDSHSDKSDKSERDFSHKPMLGRTPNHLSLSTTSTLSTGSTGSTAAKLIQSSNPPTNYQPQRDPPAGSPVWKPRDGMAPPDKSPMLGGRLAVSGQGGANGGTGPPTSSQQQPPPSSQQQQYFVYDEYGGSVYLTPPSAKKYQFVAGRHIDC